jgi:hypothetical protein
MTSLSNSNSDAKASANGRLGQWRELSRLSWATALVESGGEEGNVHDISTPFATSRPEARRGELRVGDTKRRVVDNGVWAMGMLERRWVQAGVV